MAKHLPDARRRGGRAAGAQDRPILSSSPSAEPLRTTGYTAQQKQDSGSNVNHVMLAAAAAFVVILILFSWANDIAQPVQPAYSSSAASNTADLRKPAAAPSAIKRSQASSATSTVRKPWPAKTILKIYHSDKECRGKNFTMHETTVEDDADDWFITIPEGTDELPGKSMRIIGPGEAKLYNGQGNYVASVVELEGCSPMFKWPPIRKCKLIHRKSDPGKKCQIDPEVQKKFATAKDITKPHTRIVYSAESSDYFGYQTLTNAYAFLNSSQTSASWLRLLTSEMPDDLSERFPTFTAPRSPYSKRYGPINKPDVIEKWFNSECDAPHPDDTIVVIDPDNFLLRDMAKWTARVSRKKALGQGAYYSGSKKVQKMWKEVCEQGCDNNIDAVGVPYVVKAADLGEIAPLWRKYSMKVKELVQTNETFKDKYERPLNVMWAAEMFGYNFACAHLSIKTESVIDMQARDVDASIPLDDPDPPAMIHMGRAWFPKQHAAAAEAWRHTEGENFINNGYRNVQVFCKCNQTASTIIPWPVPSEGLDWQSYHTLRLMHDGVKHFGGVPLNETFRHKPPQGYYWTKP